MAAAVPLVWPRSLLESCLSPRLSRPPFSLPRTITITYDQCLCFYFCSLPDRRTQAETLILKCSWACPPHMNPAGLRTELRLCSRLAALPWPGHWPAWRVWPCGFQTGSLYGPHFLSQSLSPHQCQACSQGRTVIFTITTPPAQFSFTPQAGSLFSIHFSRLLPGLPKVG